MVALQVVVVAVVLIIPTWCWNCKSRICRLDLTEARLAQAAAVEQVLLPRLLAVLLLREVALVLHLLLLAVL
jgi:hypothetical protein